MSTAVALLGAVDAGLLREFLDTQVLPHSRSVSVISCAQAPTQKYSTLILLGERASAQDYAQAASHGQPGCQVTAFGLGKDGAKLSKDLTLAGLLDCSAKEEVTVAGAKLGAATATRPTWEDGAADALPVKDSKRAADVAKLWATVEPAGGPGNELIDGDALLKESDLQKPSLPDADGCATSKRACKNCTCGRAEQEAPEKVKLTPDMLENPQNQGGCGNCALGDAFRCAGCPYKGMPAFTPGEPIKLGGDALNDL
ncbi:unnamed protein product [Pedinophyceae sp. YPF-701]|nr:unnamed protein product [Pedinophyceae sp. YPF-701]